ncbi:TolC family protein [Aquirufa nivalisilvae]|uniref:TolC family protein n=1 Tax=Aquirufa nivalisilvae TaxID=2516557 RepID=UPI001032E7F5|nr:TolC family protein [Aquirufa nivalisilvae]MCZ2480685.1 TolC family protein [Aquirufa nivalisilvae]MCZ2482923.1 TolC family protein [Aquirufa nivalisilvae]TBH71022.1 TolC family protein [Aquirufa nivalisilvae]
MSYFKICSLFLMLLLAFGSKAQSDTLSITIAQADKVFLSTNYQLLATSLNIDVQKAQVLQASLYPNPVLTVDMNAIDPENSKIFHLGNTGQQSVQLEQLILLGGKRKAQIDLAKTNVEMAELAFQDLIRQLKFELHTGLYLLNQQQILIGKYTKQMAMVDNILSTYEIQAHKGNIPLKDVVRLKGVYLNLSNERAAIFGDYFQQLSKVQTLLQTKSMVVPKVSDAEIQSFIQPFDVQLLIDQALENRPDLLLGKKDAVFAEQYFSLQKKLAKPDITLFSSYDQRGGAFLRQVNVGVAIPLMFWNRNQGNIKSAETQIKVKQLFVDGLKSQVIAEVQSTYLQYKQTVSEFLKNNKLYDEDFEVTLKGMTENFQKGNVSLIEFVDFFESYNNALSEISRIKIQLATSAEQIKLSTGKELF